MTIKDAIDKNGSYFEFEGKEYLLIEANAIKAREEYVKEQKEMSDAAFREKARFNALEVAQSINISPNGLNPLEDNAGRMNEDRIVDVSEKIYQWLIKVIK